MIMTIKLLRTLFCLAATVLLMFSVSFAQSANTSSHGEMTALGKAEGQDAKVAAATAKADEQPPITVPANYNPSAVLRAARIIFIRSKSAYLKSSDLENELRQRPEFTALGLLISKEEETAELIVEVGRKVPGRKFVYTAIDPKTQIVLTSGSAKADLLGLEPSVAHKIAKRFLQRVQAVR